MNEPTWPETGNENGDSLTNKKILTKEEIYYNKKAEQINIGSRLYNFKSILDIHGFESPVHDCYFTDVYFDIKTMETFVLNPEAYKKLKMCHEEYKAKVKYGRKKETQENQENQLDKDWETFSNKNKEFTLFGIRKEFLILYIILILGFIRCHSMEISNEISSGDYIDGKFVEKEILKNPSKAPSSPDYNKLKNGEKYMEPKFNYTFIYDVNTNKCVSTEYYKYKFSYNDLKNPRLVVEFQDRPGELTLVTPNGDMFVFTDTEEHCILYKQKFLEELRKQNKQEENKYNIED